MVRPISVASSGFISNSLKPLALASEGMLIAPIIASPKFSYSVDHNLNKLKRTQEIIMREEKEILEIIAFIAKRIL